MRTSPCALLAAMTMTAACSGQSPGKGGSPSDSVATGPDAAGASDAGSFDLPDGYVAPETGDSDALTADASVSGGDALTTDASDASVSMPPPTCTDPCACDPGNDDPAHALPYTPGTTLSACLSSTGDLDYYAIETPANQPGGVIAVTVDYMGLDTFDVAVFVGTDATEVFDEQGGPVSLWFAAAPSTKYVIEVSTSYDYEPSAYTFEATYTAVTSPSKPGSTKYSALPITVGTPVQALMFAGYTTDQIDTTAWWQWYEVTLADGNATVSITNVPSDLTLEAYLYDSTSNSNTIHGYGSASAGGSIMFTTSSPVTAGTYYVQVDPVDYTTQAYGGGTTPGPLATQPYTLSVTQ
jgi:hypothetical protein